MVIGRISKAKLFIFLLELIGLIVLLSFTGRASTTDLALLSTKGNNPLLWQLGTEDGSAEEFTGSGSNTHSVTLASKGETAVSGSVPSGLNGSVNPVFQIEYNLEKIPKYGVLFRVKILNAYKSVPQMAVFSNGQLSGIIQIGGASGTGSGYSFDKAYELYIPKEQLQTGSNELKLQTVRCLYCSSAEDPYTWLSWDDLSLEALSAPADEPIHGSYVLTGTNVNNYEFYYDEGAVRHLPYILKWLGLAYSGNMMRVSCASNVGDACSSVGDYYKVLKQYNTQAVAMYLYTGDIKLNADGSLPEAARRKLTDYFKAYGSYFQYYEVDNEPGLFNRSKAVDMEVARWLNKQGKQIAPHLKTVAPGWAYWPAYSIDACQNQSGRTRTCGDPDGWERDPKQRLELERVTDLTNGHAYGSSYADPEGGSLTENLLTFQGAKDAFSKQMLTTEFGTSDSHTDLPAYGASKPQSAAFDRIMRAHIGFADMFIQHAAFFKDYSLFASGFDLSQHNPAKTEIYGFKSGGDSRVDIMRRLTLAYATHGKPLPYQVLNTEETRDKLVYVRAVDTSTLKPLAGSGATSNKILLNFVNFENSAQTLKVKMTMPEKLVYEGERFGPGETYEQARTYVTGLEATPDLTFNVTLGPGEAVQYILQPSSLVKAQSPAWVHASGDNRAGVLVEWEESEGAKSYDVLRSDRPSGSFQTIASEVKQTEYTDHDVAEGTTYRYAVRANGSEAMSVPSLVTFTGEAELDRKGWKVSSNIDRGKSGPQGAIDGNPRTRWDTASNQTPGSYYQIDLGDLEQVGRITLEYAKSPYDYPRQYEVDVSADGMNWKQAAVGKGEKERTDISFAQVRARFVRISQRGTGGNYWSIHELRMYSGK
ncbi:discoidin domain-containing protein [Paenibacillus caui]|uniref:discoidin domain-containing protein n=1 Tax=Paenibacillus caui TaxID=2873927 RepID=UPI001CA7C607|nr:discoidin domain-containing protein [Paenibacillus caui]